METVYTIIIWTCVCLFVVVAIVTVLDLLGIFQIPNQKRGDILFKVLIVEVVIISVGVFAYSVKPDPTPSTERGESVAPIGNNTSQGIRYLTWNHNNNDKHRVEAVLIDGKFSNAHDGNWMSATPSDEIAYISNMDTRWYAKIVGASFLYIPHTREGGWLEANAIQYLDWDGNLRFISVSDFPRRQKKE